MNIDKGGRLHLPHVPLTVFEDLTGLQTLRHLDKLYCLNVDP